MDRLAGINAKIEWAEKHISNLDVWLSGLGDTQPYVLRSKPHPIAEIQHTTIYVESVDELGASLFIGDCAHNLRSSLDHLAWQLVEAGGGSPNKDTFFPICDVLSKYGPAIGKGEIEKMRDGAKKLLREIQPCNGGDGLLWAIHELDRIDKHRYLLTTMMAVADFGVHFGSNRMLWLGQGFGVERESFPLEAGYEVMNIPTGTFQRQSQQDFKLAIDISFRDPEIVKGKPVLPLLKQMADFVRVVVDRFAFYLS